MTRNRPQLALCLAVALLLVTGAWTVLRAQEVIAPEEVPLGAIMAKELAVFEAEVYPPDENLDGLPELNPVDEKGLEELAAGYTKDDTVFQKYAYIPGCASGGCPGGIDHMAAGTGTRNTGYGTIRLRGVPAGARKVSAFLYWSEIYQGPIPANPTIYFNGFRRTGVIVNSTPFPCWGPNATHVTYRTWVFPYIVPGINSDYSVTGLASGLTTGQDPWVPYNTVFPLSQGASLVVLYTDKSIPRGTWVQIHHPQTTQFFGTLTFTHLLTLPITVDSIKHTRIGSDGQVGRRHAEHQLDDRREDVPRRAVGDAAGADPGQRLLGHRQRGLRPQRDGRRADEPALGHPHDGGLGGDHAAGDQLHGPVHRAHAPDSGLRAAGGSRPDRPLNPLTLVPRRSSGRRGGGGWTGRDRPERPGGW